MRIGLFSDTYRPMVNGITYTLDILHDELTDMGHEVYIFAPAPSLRYKEPHHNVVRFTAVKDVFFKDQLTSLFFPPRQIKKVKALDLDVVHFFTPSQIGLFSAFFALKQDIPLVTTYYTDLYEYVRHYPSVLPGILALTMTTPVALRTNVNEFRQAFAAMKPKKTIAGWNQQIVSEMLTVLHNKCDSVIVPSHKMHRQLTEWGTETPIHILPTGVDALPVTQNTARSRERLSLRVNDKVVLYVGRLGSEKNLELAIDAFDMLAHDCPNAKFVIVGNHEYRAVLEEKAATKKHCERIIFTGVIPREELGDIYAMGDVFLFPSVTDTQGLVLHEAVAAGLPIVMIDQEVTEVVQDGVNGFFAENEADAVATKLAAILNDDSLAQRMSVESRRIAEKYTARIQARKIEALYLQLTQQTTHPRQSLAGHTDRS